MCNWGGGCHLGTPPPIHAPGKGEKVRPEPHYDVGITEWKKGNIGRSRLFPEGASVGLTKRSRSLERWQASRIESRREGGKGFGESSVKKVHGKPQDYRPSRRRGRRVVELVPSFTTAEAKEKAPNGNLWGGVTLGAEFATAVAGGRRKDCDKTSRGEVILKGEKRVLKATIFVDDTPTKKKERSPNSLHRQGFRTILFKRDQGSGGEGIRP